MIRRSQSGLQFPQILVLGSGDENVTRHERHRRGDRRAASQAGQTAGTAFRCRRSQKDLWHAVGPVPLAC